jgi:hypothetical protein
MPAPEIALTTPPARDELLRQLTRRLALVVPGMQLLAQGLRGADAEIDFVALEPDGRVSLILVGEHGEDLELVGAALAQRKWVTERLRDWLQLAPNLRIRPEAGVRVVLLCPAFQPQTLAAAEALGPRCLGLARYRCVRHGDHSEVLVEHVTEALETPEHSAPRPPGGSSEPSPFRSGLTDDDLGLTDAERAEFA